MDFSQWFAPEILPWIFPVIIFFARILDVTVGTLRIVFITRGKTLLAPILGFVEVLVWLVIVSQVIQNIDNVANFIAYAAGYATGNYVGMFIENKLALGLLMVRIVTRKDASELIKYLKENNYGFTNVPAYGNDGQVNVIFTVIKRRKLPIIIDTVKKFNPRAFFSVEDVRSVSEGIFPSESIQLDYLRYFRPLLKGK